jgi:hypothetical protein
MTGILARIRAALLGASRQTTRVPGARPWGELSEFVGKSPTTHCHQPQGVLPSSRSNNVTTKPLVPAGAAANCPRAGCRFHIDLLISYNALHESCNDDRYRP